nr:MAG TPA: hypothetical protein [Caudoviricetes sp.]
MPVERVKNPLRKRGFFRFRKGQKIASHGAEYSAII